MANKFNSSNAGVAAFMLSSGDGRIDDLAVTEIAGTKRYVNLIQGTAAVEPTTNTGFVFAFAVEAYSSAHLKIPLVFKGGLWIIISSTPADVTTKAGSCVILADIP